MPNRVQVIEEARLDEKEETTLCFQWCQYVYDDGTSEHGYRFIWRNEGRQMAHRGQARIPSISDLERLVAQARREGWGDYGE